LAWNAKEEAVAKPYNLSITLAACLGLALVATPVFAADAPAKTAADAKKPAADAKAAAAKPAAKDPNAPAMPANLSDSPYGNGAPAITGGYTDTSQGGTKGSGDPLAAPPTRTGAPGAAPAGK
jgi:membrane protein involved in colicin uptake